MGIRLTKLKELPDAKVPGNIPEGDIKEFENNDGALLPPMVGRAFWPCQWYHTSVVMEIIDEWTFKTHNSIYKYEIL